MAKCKVLILDQGNSKHNYRLGGEWIENRYKEKYLGESVDEKQHKPSMCTCSQESHLYTEQHQRSLASTSWSSLFILSNLFSWDPTCSTLFKCTGFRFAENHTGFCKEGKNSILGLLRISHRGFTLFFYLRLVFDQLITLTFHSIYMYIKRIAQNCKWSSFHTQFLAKKLFLGI